MKTQLALLTLCLGVAGLAAQTKPDHRDVAYDTADKAQVLDVYLAKAKKPAPVMVYIHGGGWRAGTKNNVPGYLLRAHAEGWLAVVSVEYRFTQVKPHPGRSMTAHVRSNSSVTRRRSGTLTRRAWA